MSDQPLFVAVGASAGGLEALRSMFNQAAADVDMTFVVVQHISPDYKSMMAELLDRSTALAVEIAKDGIVPQRGTVYVIEPQTLIRMEGGALRIEHTERGSRVHQPINVFFESVAASLESNCVGVVLSGTGSDGALGLAAIKEQGGVVVVQDPKTASFDGMPNAAIRTGTTDMVLPPSLIVQELSSLQRSSPGEYFGLGGDHGSMVLNRITSQLRERTGVDFVNYKPATVVRRIERRMAMLQLNDPREYAERVRGDEQEVDTLYRDMLIGVTRFLRDAGAIEKLSTIAIPKLTELAQTGPLRLWVAGCSTGEEAYTIAMLLRDALEKARASFSFRIFATDVDSKALEFAAAGEYPEALAEHLNEGMLARHFLRRSHTFVARPELRDHILFSRHDVVEDPPFSRLDFVSCRNLLIYLKPKIQERVIRTFSSALNPEGLLWLGSSETVGSLKDQFDTLDSRWRIYQGRSERKKHVVVPRSFSPLAVRRAPKAGHGDQRAQERIQGAVEGALLGYAPPTLFIDEQYRLVYRYGDLSHLLEVPLGRVTTDVRDMLPNELATIVGTSLTRARTTEAGDIVYRTLRTTSSEDSDESYTFDLRVRYLPSTGARDSLYALIFERLQSGEVVETSVDLQEVSGDVEVLLAEARRELTDTRANLQSTIEELESANEELQSTNEELIASNEELQSTNEELQSVNEELHTVNSEHQQKVAELTELTDELDDVLAAIEVGIVLLDHELCVSRFNDFARNYINILPLDVGRPVSHLTHTLAFGDLIDRVSEVLREGKSITRTTRSQNGQNVLVKIDARSAGTLRRGVVLTFADISKLVAAEKNTQHLVEALDTAGMCVATLDAQGTIVATNRSFAALAGRDIANLSGRDIRKLALESDEEMVRRSIEMVTEGNAWHGIVRGQTPAGTQFWEVVDMVPSATYDKRGPKLLRMSRDLSTLLMQQPGQVRGQADTEFWLWDPDAGTTYFTQGLPSQWGVDREGLRFENLRHLMAEKEYVSLRAELNQARATNATVRTTISIATMDEPRQLRLIAQPCRGAHGVGLIAGESTLIRPEPRTPVAPISTTA